MGSSISTVSPSDCPEPAEPFMVDGKNVCAKICDPKIISVALCGYPQEYLDAKKRVKEDFVTLSSGKKICYFADGAPSGMPMICMHGGGEGKWAWLHREPIPGVYQIAIDRMGYGKSDIMEDMADGYYWEEVIADFKEFVDKLGIEQFVCCGFSIGTSWSLQIAASNLFKERLRGIILFATMADTSESPGGGRPLGRDRMTADEMATINRPQGFIHPVKGCCGCVLRYAFSMNMEPNRKFDFTQNFAEDAGDPRSLPEFKKLVSDPFWLCTKIDSFQAFNRSQALMGDANRSLYGPWKWDIADIKCPVFLFQGEGDTAMGAGAAKGGSPEWVKRCVPHTVFETIPGAGHMSSIGPIERTRQHIATALAAMPLMSEAELKLHYHDK